MKTYKTSEVAKLIGVHPNTVRLYEEGQLISPTKREKNGYRTFTDLHLAQFQMARTAFQIEVLQNGLRKEVVEIVKVTAKKEFTKAIKLTEAYIAHLKEEKSNAEEAISITEQLLQNSNWLGGNIQEKSKAERGDKVFTRKQAADYLKVTIDTLRNWELNGLVTVKRKENGYRIYNEEDINRLKVIRALRCANYSLEAILRMLNALAKDPKANIRVVIDTPINEDEEDIVSCCDQLLSSLSKAEENAVHMRGAIIEMKAQYSENSHNHENNDDE